MTLTTIVSAQGEIITTLANGVTGFGGRVFAVYPMQATDYPCGVVDVVGGAQYRRIIQNMDALLFRISAIDTDALTVDTLSDAVENCLENATTTLVSYHGVQSRSPRINDETISAQRRDLDVEIRILQNRV